MRRASRLGQLSEHARLRVRAILSRSPSGHSWAAASANSVRTWELLSDGWWVLGAEAMAEVHVGRQLSHAEQSSLQRAERVMYSANIEQRNGASPNLREAAELELELERLLLERHERR